MPLPGSASAPGNSQSTIAHQPWTDRACTLAEVDIGMERTGARGPALAARALATLGCEISRLSGTRVTGDELPRELIALGHPDPSLDLLESRATLHCGQVLVE